MAPFQFKIVIIGPSGVGKTTFSRYLLQGIKISRHVHTLGVEAHPIRVLTTRGEVILNLWDTAGHPLLSGLKEGYYVRSEGAIAMCDLSNQGSIDLLSSFVVDLPHVPLAIVGTHNDNLGYLGTPKIEWDRPSESFRINTLSDDSWKPILWLIRTLTNDPHLSFVPKVEKIPPTIDGPSPHIQAILDKLDEAVAIAIAT